MTSSFTKNGEQVGGLSPARENDALQLRTLDRDAWETETKRFSDHNYRQLWAFGLACAERVGATSEHIAVMDGRMTVGLADVRCRRLPLFGGGVAYVSGGPLVMYEGNTSPERLHRCLTALTGEYVQRRGMVLRIAPAIGAPEWDAQRIALFAQQGFVPTPHARTCRTLVVDIARPLSSIRSTFEQKWRNCLNRSERNSLDIKAGTDDGLFDKFCKLYDELTTRKGFTLEFDAAFYRAVQQRAAPAEKFHLAIAHFRGEPAAGVLANFVGDTAVYLLGGCNILGMQQKATYLLQWHVIEAAQKNGCTRYDLGGIDPTNNAGVYHFKAGMGGLDTVAPGPFELRPTRVAGAVINAAERIYRGLRTMRRRLGLIV